jgi:hypothetical protein
MLILLFLFNFLRNHLWILIIGFAFKYFYLKNRNSAITADKKYVLFYDWAILIIGNGSLIF